MLQLPKASRGRWVAGALGPSAAFPARREADLSCSRGLTPEEGVPSDGPSIQDSQGASQPKGGDDWPRLCSAANFSSGEGNPTSRG